MTLKITGRSVAFLLVALAGCLPVGGPKPAAPPAAAAATSDLSPIGPISAVDLLAGRLVPVAGRLSVAGARNETLGFAVRLQQDKIDPAAIVRATDFARIGSPSDRIAAANVTLGQIVDVPVDLNRAGFVRQNGGTVEPARTALPRAVLPVAANATLGSLRPATPEQGTLFWVDLAIPTQSPPGEYIGSVEIAGPAGIAARLPIALTVYDLVLPDARSLTVVGQVGWTSLERHFTDAFEAITPKLVNRTDARYRPPVRVLDGLVTLAQSHRLTLNVDRLQPTVKWNPFSVNWDDFDSLVGPWLDGNGFADREPLSLWPLPSIDYLSNYPASAQREYYANAASHFDARDWLTRAPVWIEPAGTAESAPIRQRLLEQAAGVLSAHSRLRVALPLQASQLRFSDGAAGGTLPRPEDDARLLTASPGLVYNTPIVTATGRANARLAPTFLRTDVPGLIPFAGAGGDERDVRVWSWLAYVRGASILRFDSVLPRADRPEDPADPNELTWFYPGKWFGVDAAVVPSLQLKWLRRAEQDHEYLALADSRGQRIEAFLMARLITKPVQIQAAQYPDPTYALMSGTADPKLWDTGLRILAQWILLRAPGQRTDDPQARNAVSLQFLQWAEPQEKPLLIGRTTLFAPSGPDGQTVDVRTFVDVYNPSDTTPRDNTVSFESAPRGWTIDPQPQPVPPLAAYQVARFGLNATVNPDAIDPRQRGRVTIQFTNGYTNRATPAPLVVPIAISRRREGNLAMNGSLDDWSDDDALCLTSPLVRMVDRPTLQNHTAVDAATPTSVYSGFSDTNFYLAFKVAGISPNPGAGQNFVRYDFRRAWFEDVVEVLVQAVYADGSLGPVLHVAVKPNGTVWSERKLDLREGTDNAWEPLEAGVRYSGRPDGTDWRGEMAIPWRAIHPVNYVEGPGRLPVLLRFNFAQHQHATGVSATWAGPVDHGRDDLFTGALVLRSDEVR